MTGETLQLDRQRNFRLSASEDDAIASMAVEEGMTYSQFVRRTLRRALFLPSNGSLTPIVGETATPANTPAIGTNPDNGGPS